MKAEDRIAIVRAYVNAYNAFDIDGMLKNLDEHIAFENYSSGTLTIIIDGIENFEIQARGIAKSFESREQQIIEISAIEEDAIIKIKYIAVLAMDLSEKLKKGDTIEMEGSSTFFFNMDKIIKIIDVS